MSWVDDLAAIGAIATAVGVGFAYVQLREAQKLAIDTRDLVATTRDIAQAEFIFRVDQSFAPFEGARRSINLGEEVDEIDVWRYAAAFERVARLLQTGQLKPETVNELYGSRFKNLVTRRNQEYIAFVRKRPMAWERFIWLYEQLQGSLGLPRFTPLSTAETLSHPDDVPPRC